MRKAIDQHEDKVFDEFSEMCSTNSGNSNIHALAGWKAFANVVNETKALISDLRHGFAVIKYPEAVYLSGLAFVCLYVYVHPFAAWGFFGGIITYALYVDHQRQKKNPYGLKFHDGFIDHKQERHI